MAGRGDETTHHIFTPPLKQSTTNQTEHYPTTTTANHKSNWLNSEHNMNLHCKWALTHKAWRYTEQQLHLSQQACGQRWLSQWLCMSMSGPRVPTIHSSHTTQHSTQPKMCNTHWLQLSPLQHTSALISSTKGLLWRLHPWFFFNTHGLHHSFCIVVVLFIASYFRLFYYHIHFSASPNFSTLSISLLDLL